MQRRLECPGDALGVELQPPAAAQGLRRHSLEDDQSETACPDGVRDWPVQLTPDQSKGFSAVARRDHIPIDFDASAAARQRSMFCRIGGEFVKGYAEILDG